MLGPPARVRPPEQADEHRLGRETGHCPLHREPSRRASEPAGQHETAHPRRVLETGEQRYDGPTGDPDHVRRPAGLVDRGSQALHRPTQRERPRVAAVAGQVDCQHPMTIAQAPHLGFPGAAAGTERVHEHDRAHRRPVVAGINTGIHDARRREVARRGPRRAPAPRRRVVRSAARRRGRRGGRCRRYGAGGQAEQVLRADERDDHVAQRDPCPACSKCSSAMRGAGAADTGVSRRSARSNRASISTRSASRSAVPRGTQAA